jgi:hypothetical protein
MEGLFPSLAGFQAKGLPLKGKTDYPQMKLMGVLPEAAKKLLLPGFIYPITDFSPKSIKGGEAKPGIILRRIGVTMPAPFRHGTQGKSVVRRIIGIKEGLQSGKVRGKAKSPVTYGKGREGFNRRVYGIMPRYQSMPLHHSAFPLWSY